MFFDNLAGIVERHLPEFVNRLSEARLFRLERRDPNFAVGEAVAKWEPDQKTIENFRLPFPTVAFEEASSRTDASTGCALLWTVNEANREYGFLVGQGSRHETYIANGTLVALPHVEQVLELDRFDRAASLRSIRAWKGCKKDGVRQVEASLLWLRQQHDRMDKLSGDEPLDRAIEKFRRGDADWETEILKLKIEDVHGKLLKLEANQINMRCVLAVFSVLVVNDPTSFVVEERPLNPLRENPNNTVQRSTGRPHFIILNPCQIRKRFLYPEMPSGEDEEQSEARKVTPHERRGHYRRLEAERFKDARGKVIWIKPMWVGPSEAIRGPNKYTVRLDL